MRWRSRVPDDESTVDDGTSELAQHRLARMISTASDDAGPVSDVAASVVGAAGPASGAVGPASGAVGPASGIAALASPAGVFGLAKCRPRDTSAEAGPSADPVADEAAVRRALAAFDPGRRGACALAVIVVLVVAVVAVIMWRDRPRTETVAVPPGVDRSTLMPTSAVSSIVVAVSGRVQRPGLVRLPAGARVADAIEAAGGVLPGTDLAYLNLARRLADGELLVVGVTPPPGGQTSVGEPGATNSGVTRPDGSAVGPLNLNTATVPELDALPGVGPVLAQRIVDYRTRVGEFRAVSDLRKVDGIGEARYSELKDLVTV